VHSDVVHADELLILSNLFSLFAYYLCAACVTAHLTSYSVQLTVKGAARDSLLLLTAHEGLQGG